MRCMRKKLLLLSATLFFISCLQSGTATRSRTLVLPEPQMQLSVSHKISEQNTAEVHNPEQEQNNVDRFSAENIIFAYKAAYPDRITEVEFRNNDWAMLIYGKWFYWAEGRLLPEDLLPEKDRFNRYPFYTYPDLLPEFSELSREQKDRLDSMLEHRKTIPLYRSPSFQNSLWRIYDRETSWSRVKTIFFLGFKLQIHRDLLEDLSMVEEEIQRRMLVDSELKLFVESLERVDGYNWRKIAGTETLSVHSYGIALDLIFNYSSNSEIYWLWTKNKGVDWYDVPYNKRFSPPDSFIKAFENNGFIWGGKWLFYDTIHFEYRPEILHLNGL